MPHIISFLRSHFLSLFLTFVFIACAAVRIQGQSAFDPPLNAITSFDAMLVYRYVAASPLPTPAFTNNHLAAADTNNSCALSTIDAALISQYVIGNAGSTTGTTITPPGPCAAFPINTNVLKGDVSGTSPVITGGLPGTPGVSLPVVTAIPGVITVQLTVGNLTALAVNSYDFQITFDPAVITPASPAFDKTGSLSSAAFVAANANNPGHLIVSGWQPGVFAGSGNLLNLRFNVIGTAGQSTTLIFQDYTDPGARAHQSFLFNEGTPSAIKTNGSITVSAASISGTITYDNAIGNPAPPRFVKNVSLSSTSGTPAVGPVITGTPGTYTLMGFGAGSYTIKPAKPGGANGAITSNDAARVAQGVSGAVQFVSQNQRFVSDASGNGTVSSNDAALIARFAAGLTGTGNVGQWKFFVTGAPSPLPTQPATYNDSRTYASVTSNLASENYVALLVGEASGNWNPATHPRTVNSGQWSVDSEDGGERKKPITVSVPDVVTATDKEIVVPVSVEGVKAKEIISYEFDLRYDPTVIQPLTEPADVAGTVSRALSVVTNATEPGLLRVVVYGAFPIDENGLLLNLKFIAVGAAGTASPLVFERIMFNEGEPRVTIADGQVELF